MTIYVCSSYRISKFSMLVLIYNFPPRINSENHF
uniref:Uncharacterized protein n=1 Tax=Arundo donax TaxID=35708 RepID=A0A0A9SY59_ARUDO